MWSCIAVACPFIAMAVAALLGRGVSEEEFPMRLVFGSWLLLFPLTLAATFLAFRRRERARWITPFGVLLILVLVFGGVPG